MALPVNFKDDVLASSMDGKRRYNMITNSDGTVSFEDVTTYSQEGSNFGSAQINNTNGAINTINNNVLDTIEQISANTSGGKFAGALALKNVNNSLNNKVVLFPITEVSAGSTYQLENNVNAKIKRLKVDLFLSISNSIMTSMYIDVDEIIGLTTYGQFNLSYTNGSSHDGYVSFDIVNQNSIRVQYSACEGWKSSNKMRITGYYSY